MESSGEKSRETSTSPAVEIENPCGLNAIPLRNVYQIVLGPQNPKQPSSIHALQVVFIGMFDHDNAFLGQDVPHPLQKVSGTSHFPKQKDRRTENTSLRSSASVIVPVTRVKPAKNHSAVVLTESTVGRSFSLSSLGFMREIKKRTKSFVVARSGAAAPGQRYCARAMASVGGGRSGLSAWACFITSTQKLDFVSTNTSSSWACPTRHSVEGFHPDL
jgi:hypothetical protein